ncbi:MAG: hypothetical protein WHT08_16345 [Bryobacteraceae bacterium]|jgi:hypothetical protein
MRPLVSALVLTAALAGATTLEKLSLDEMVQKATAVVRARATASGAVQRGTMIYTVYQLQVAEVMKGALPAGVTEVYVPGGTYGRYRQSIAGSPELAPGVEYVLFLWASPRGLVQIIGLSQGVFETKHGDGHTLLVRGKVEAEFVDRTGRAVEDNGMRLSLQELRDKIARSAAQGASR